MGNHDEISYISSHEDHIIVRSSIKFNMQNNRSTNYINMHCITYNSLFPFQEVKENKEIYKLTRYI